MATTTVVETRPAYFSRLTEARSSKSWKAAIPAVLVVVAFVALLGYLASKLSSSEQKAMSAQRDSQQLRDQQAGLVRQIGSLQGDLAFARSPGRTTVILQSPAKEKASTWAAMTWGEAPDGKTWIRTNVYGLATRPEQGKAYHVWFQPQTGDPVNVGSVDTDDEGNGSVISPATLPGVDQGKSVQLTLDDSSAKAPGEVVAQADLPKLKPVATAPAAAPATGADEPQAKTNDDTKKMHQGK